MPERSAQPNRLLACVALAPLLTGCWDDQRRQNAECHLEATEAFPGDRLTIGSRMESAIITCMRLHGYIATVTPAGCTVSPAMAADPHCYVPSGQIARLLFTTTTFAGP